MSTEQTRGWRELWRKEDWWAVWIGLSIVAAACLAFANGSSLRWLAVVPPRWTAPDALLARLAADWPRYLALLGFWLAVFALALRSVGQRVAAFVPGFAIVFAAATLIFVAGQWQGSTAFNLEPPLLALLLGLVVANTVTLPDWLAAGLRGELYVKTGIVLLGATLPLSLIALAGPVALAQASIVSLATFGAIYVAAVRLGLDRRFAATLGVGGAVCGVSAAIAVAGAVNAKREHVAITITLVILWAIAMIFALPAVAWALGLPTGVAGAWIGTSEFADAAGIAAAQAYGGLAERTGAVAGTTEQALQAFTLVKVVGRDMWIGIWAVALAIVATTRWEARPGSARPDPREIWIRFPKFVFGFLIASAIISFFTAGYSLAEYNRVVAPDLVGPIRDLRTWAFILCFLSIGLTTRLRDLARAGPRPFGAFTIGVAVNLALGAALSIWLLRDHWARLGS
ncbi:putative sulfate exporter family transporter [Sphingomonas sp. BK235]|uniref:YeiH family protein n=1 Tax=Sphingomonas sp. BK235 TaxID=2512131 RepID=UPI0010440EE6|nr:putative sulfate exporter family transporter [Sphingomonas sp. BK235]TCP34174.1 putative membrane protein YadS [Sphingomonas sp. BK235]